VDPIPSPASSTLMEGLSNGLGILLARAIWSQGQDLAHHLAASLPVRKRAPSSAAYRADTSRHLTHTATRAAAIPC
jgi:hypothetical protein